MAPRMFLEVDGDQVTAVELSGDIAVSSATFNAGTLSGSLQSALAGFKQRRSDPPLEVSLVPPGFSFTRMEASSEDFEDVSRLRSEATAGGDFLPAVWLPEEPPAEGYVVPAFALAVAPELPLEVSEALSGLRYRLFLSPSCVPGDGLWVGIHMSCSTLSLVRGGRLLHASELSCGGLAGVSTLVSPDDAMLGMQQVVSVLSGAEDSMLVSAELGRFYRSLTRAVNGQMEELSDRPDVEDMPASVCFFGVGANERLLGEALRGTGIAYNTPDPVLQALTYLPVSRRPASIGALGPAASRPPELVLDQDDVTEGTPEARSASLVASRVLLAFALGIFGATMFTLGTDLSQQQALEAELGAFPAHLAAAGDLGGFSFVPIPSELGSLLSQLPGMQLEGLSVSGISWSASGLSLTLSGAQSDFFALPEALSQLGSMPGVVSVRAAGLEGDGRMLTLDVALEASYE